MLFLEDLYIILNELEEINKKTPIIVKEIKILML